MSCRLIFNFNYLCELRWFFAELVKVCHLDDDNACGWVSMVLMMQRRISVKDKQLILERSDKDKKFMTWKDKRYERWIITVKFFLLCKFWIQSMRNGFLKIRDLNLRITNLKSSSSINFQHWNKNSILFSKADMFEFSRQNHI